MFNRIPKLFVIKPYIVDKLFTPIMLSAFFNKQYIVQIDALDDSKLLQITRGQPWVKIKLHTNAITGAIILLNHKDLIRLKKNSNKLTLNL